MKKVRFETPTKNIMDNIMQDYECQSPRPFIERQIVNIGNDNNFATPVVFSNDPVHRFENSNSFPHPSANKTCVNTFQKLESGKVPSSDLDLSMLDCSQPRSSIQTLKRHSTFGIDTNRMNPIYPVKSTPQHQVSHKILTAIENKTTEVNPPNILNRDNNFFLKKENLGKLSFNPILQQRDSFCIPKENDPISKKNELIRMGNIHDLTEKENYAPPTIDSKSHCKCHHCVKVINRASHTLINNTGNVEILENSQRINYGQRDCLSPSNLCSCRCNLHIIQPKCHWNNPQQPPLSSQNAIDKKAWAIEKYERTRDAESKEVEKSNAVLKEQKEPTVSDLFKIIKLQNEQLQLLQEKVDRFISTHKCEVQDKQTSPIHNYVTEQLALQTVNSEQRKISIGVMTSFEMVRRSTVINKEIIKQCEAQIQCNRSQISIKEVVSKKQADHLNFLDGIPPVSKDVAQIKGGNVRNCFNVNNNEGNQTDNINEDKTLNELSLYNVQVDNATTPLMSPEQSLYLDIRDYSESDSGSDDQSNVGWTYYNKVMTHVNGMLQDSDMPSSASALYRHTKQKCMQMQIDKSNVSVGKRVTFGDDPLGVQQHHLVASTDTSLKMNQLAAKYLKHPPASCKQSPVATGEMSFGTRNYMERHKLLQGPHAQYQQDIPKFLDVTALKQQPKLI